MRGHERPLSYHARLLADVHRLDAFERALRARVRPGDVVLDLGCGTGILAMLAARRGARVHAVESMPVVRLARELVAANGVSHCVTVYHADLTTLPPVDLVDLVVGDFLGGFLVDDGMLPAVQAAGRWLKPGGGFCPSRVQLHLAPVGGFALAGVDVFRDPFYGLDLRAALPHALGECARANLPAASVLASPALYYDYLPPAAPEPFDRELRFVVERAGVLRGLAGWFTAELAAGVTLSTAPGIETHWGQRLFPLDDLAVEPGDEVVTRLHLDAPADLWRWEGTVRRGEALLRRFVHHG
jgi:SAM-dependent methyltransferase